MQAQRESVSSLHVKEMELLIPVAMSEINIREVDILLLQ
jgi:hypothetical protein